MPKKKKLPSQIKIIDTGTFIDVNLDEMVLEGDTGRVTISLRKKLANLKGALAEHYYYVMLHALNGRRKVSTVSRWISEFDLFIRTTVGLTSQPVAIITFEMYNKYTSTKKESQCKTLRSAILYWIRQRKPGIEKSLADYLQTSKAPKPRQTFEIQNAVEKERPFSISQVRDILGTLDELYIRNILDAQENLLWRLIISEGLRPSQLYLLQFGDLQDCRKHNNRINVLIPVIKQQGTAGRDYMLPTKMSEGVSSAIREHLIFVDDLLGSQAPDNLPLFSVRRQNNKYAVLKKQVSIIHMIQRTRKLLATHIPQLDKYDFFTRRFKHTKLTHLAILGAPLEVLARSGYQTSTISLRHYTNLSDDAYADYEERLSSQHDTLHSSFRGTIVQKDDATNLDSEHLIWSTSLDGHVGSCSATPCGVFAPIGCYDCPRFEAFEDGEHKPVLSFLKEKLAVAKRMGLPADALNRDAHLIAAVESVISKIQNSKSDD